MAGALVLAHRSTLTERLDRAGLDAARVGQPQPV